METTKEKSAHTPGPWAISCIEGIRDSLMVGGGDDGSDIVADIRTMEDELYDAETFFYDGIQNARSRAHVEGWSEDSVASIDKDEIDAKKKVNDLRKKVQQANANARLIAAAPEMYKMLRDLSKVVKNLESIGASLPYYFKDDMSISDKLRELLAKVEGGEG